ncbi:MAG: winged helix-turn-helix transcriptional regulator [Candidatus Lokiarchaeota archaeon]|nr:winged helix-turn-helix transcriptional regulator [Candidatus Lokiarchaeota archaeon]
MSERSEKPMVTSFEKQYIETFGEFYESRGMTKILGQVYAILAYKARDADNGLTQQEIADIIDRSVSTASRVLDQLSEMGFCGYIEEINPRGRRERKYYMSSSIKQIAVGRFFKLIKDNIKLENELSQIEESIPKSEKKENRPLIKHLNEMKESIQMLNSLYKRMIEIGKDVLTQEKNN